MLDNTFPQLQGDSIVLRAWQSEDMGFVLSVVDDPLIPLISSVPRTHDEDEARAFIARQHERFSSGAGWTFAISEEGNSGAVGFAGVLWTDREGGRASLGYWIGQDHRGHGYASHAIKTLANWALTQDGLERLEAHVEPWNTHSQRALVSTGFAKEGLLRSWAPIGGERKDVLIYARTTT